MKTNLELSIYKVVLLFIAGVIAGGAIAMVLTNDMSMFGGSLQVISMILISIAILISSRKNVKDL